MLTPDQLLFELLDRNLVLAIKTIENGNTSKRSLALLEQLLQTEMAVLSYLYSLQGKQNESANTSSGASSFECLPPTQPTSTECELHQGVCSVSKYEAAS